YKAAAVFRPEDANNLRDMMRIAGTLGSDPDIAWAGLRMLEGTWLSEAGDVWGEAEKTLSKLVKKYRTKGMVKQADDLEKQIAKGKVKDIVVQIKWDTNKTDVDMHVMEPGGHSVSYQNKTSFRGGVLDHDDTDGHGPETYTLKRASKGEYKVSVHYFSARNLKKPTNVTITIWQNKGGANEQKRVHHVTLKREKEKKEVEVIKINK
ncbi:YfaP family protein, partial [Planctomycetota bacterium]